MDETSGTPDSIFTKIIKGEIPCHKIYEDELTFVFLDIHPIQPGHSLVVPKRQVTYLWDLEPTDYSAIMAVAQKLAHAIRAAFPDKQLVGMHVEGLDVPHAHVHLYPFNNAEEFRTVPNHDSEPDHTALAAAAQKIIEKL